jgi:acyl-coenzyme A thioesterase PaaI-like protein
VDEGDLRPGATVSGPTMMGLADIASYSLILAHLGEAALAVTTSLSIDFLRRPVGPTLVCDADLVKLGRSLAVSRITIVSADVGVAPNMAEPEAIANVTYSLSLVR